MTRWLLVVVGSVAIGCHGSNPHHDPDAAPGDGATVDSPAHGDGAVDAVSDAPVDGWVGTACTSIRPWCVGSYCLAIPALPARVSERSSIYEGRLARTPGVNGEAWIGMERALGHVTATGGLEMIVLPGGGRVTGLSALSPNDIYACAGTDAWHYDGQQWSAVPAYVPNVDCQALLVTAPDDVWEIEEFGGFLSHRSNGTVTNYGQWIYAMDARSPSDVWFGGENGYVAHWDGTQFQVLVDISQDSDVPTILDVHVLGPNDVALGTNRLINGVMTPTTQLGYPAKPKVTWGTSDDFWIEGVGVSQGTLWHYAGGSWTQFPHPADTTVKITGTGPSDVWFFWDHAISHWDGQTLTDCASWGVGAPGGGKLRGLAADYSDLWMLEGSSLARSVNGGDFVEDGYVYGTRGFDARPGAGVFAVAGLDDDNPGVQPIARHFDGSAWTDIACPAAAGADQLLLSAKAFAANDAWFAGDAGTVFHWDGSACTLVPHPLASTPYSVVEGTGPNDVWFFGASATLHWDGTALTRYAQTITASDAFATGTSLWVVGGGDVKQWDGTTWTSKGVGSSIGSTPQIWASSDADVWVASSSGTAHFDGSTWSEDSPASPLPTGSDVGIWGSGTAGDFMLSRGGAVLHHQ
jgi:hypothetical protein